MRARTVRMTPLMARKELLVVESEINRVELGRECSVLRAESTEFFSGLTGDANALGSLASAGAALFTTGSALRRVFFNGDGAHKTSWVQTLINGARAGISVWLALRPRVR